MTNIISIYFTLGFWAIMAIYWIVKATTDSQTKISFEISSILKLVSSALIIYLPLLIDGWFAKQLFLTNSLTSIMGVVICGMGIMFAIWGRATLGKNWSGKVMIQKKHSLIQTGAYGITRHPQYTGFLFALLGTALVIGQIFSFVWSVFLIIGLIVKAKQEEKILAEKFPEEYPKYKKKVSMIIPYIY